METTTYRMKATDEGTLQPVSVWKTGRFQRFVAITIGTGLLLSLVAVFTMKSSVDKLTQVQVPYIQSQLNKLHS